MALLIVQILGMQISCSIFLFFEFSVATSNGIQTGSSAENIRELLSYYVLLGFLSIILIWIAWTTWIVSAERQIRRIRFNLFRNILRQEIGWFDLHNTGELTSRLITDLGR